LPEDEIVAAHTMSRTCKAWPAIGLYGAIAAVASLLTQWLRFSGRPRPPSPRQRAIDEAHRARAASQRGDAADINARMEQHRLRGRVPCFIAALLASCVGCVAYRTEIATLRLTRADGTDLTPPRQVPVQVPDNPAYRIGVLNVWIARGDWLFIPQVKGGGKK
jgi:hypothetical protein